MLQLNALQMMHKPCLKKGDFRCYINSKCCWTLPFHYTTILLRWILLSSLHTMLCQPEKQIFWSSTPSLTLQIDRPRWIKGNLWNFKLVSSTVAQQVGGVIDVKITLHRGCGRYWARFGDIWECRDHTAGKWNAHKMLRHIVLGEIWRLTYGRVSKSNTFDLAFFACKHG